MSDSDPNLEEMKSFYDGVYYANADKPLQGDAHLERLCRKIHVGDGEKVLDVACGLGEWLHACHGAGAEVAGVDLAERAIEDCKKHMPAERSTPGRPNNCLFQITPLTSSAALGRSSISSSR